MAYKWKPNAKQRREFAAKMQDPQEREAYAARKEKSAAAKRKTSKYDYSTSGGYYTPTRAQYAFALEYPGPRNPDQQNALDIVASGYSLNEKVHHDFIHIVNKLMRES